MRKKIAAGPEAKKIMAARGREKKRQQALYPGEMAWFGGRLYFIDTEPPQEVPEAKRLSKKGGEAKGLEGAFSPSFKGKIPFSRSSIIFFRDLPKASDADGQCCSCGRGQNPAILVNTRDEGRKQVVICRNCSTLMRPFKRKSRFRWV